MMRGTLAALFAWVTAVAPAHAVGLTSPDQLAKTYELVLDARFDEADEQLKHACGPAPAAGCQVLRAVSLYWQLLFDPENTSRDPAVLTSANTAIASAEAWVAREPKRAEAWFYLGGAYGSRVLMHDLRGQLLAAARDGKRIHDALQQCVTLDPTLQDAYFGLGLYHYYAAIAPTAAKLLRWLLLLPSGDRAGGLREMQQTQTRGLILRGEADYQLHLIYLWYEHRPMDALQLAEGLRTRYPHNPLFALRVAAIQSEYFRNTRASLQTYRSLLEAARDNRVAYPGITEVDAHLGMAEQRRRRRAAGGDRAQAGRPVFVARARVLSTWYGQRSHRTKRRCGCRLSTCAGRCAVRRSPAFDREGARWHRANTDRPRVPMNGREISP
jgi:hypothetical protein